MGKLFVVVLVLVSTLWIPIITAYPGAELFDYIQSTTSYLAPPICAVFLLAVFWPRCNEPGAKKISLLFKVNFETFDSTTGAVWALAVGIVLGMSRCARQGKRKTGLFFLHNISLYRFILEVSYRIPPCGSTKDPPPDWWYTIVRR